MNARRGLSNNKLTGSIPTELGSLTNLQTMYVLFLFTDRFVPTERFDWLKVTDIYTSSFFHVGTNLTDIINTVTTNKLTQVAS